MTGESCVAVEAASSMPPDIVCRIDCGLGHPLRRALPSPRLRAVPRFSRVQSEGSPQHPPHLQKTNTGEARGVAGMPQLELSPRRRMRSAWATPLDLLPESGLYYRADHKEFAAAGVPSCGCVAAWTSSASRRISAGKPWPSIWLTHQRNELQVLGSKYSVRSTQYREPGRAHAHAGMRATL